MLQIDEIGTVGERISQLIDRFANGNKTAFGRAAGLQSGLLAGIVGPRQSKPSFEVLQKILTGYPTLNPTWLLFGRGEMLLPTGPSYPVETAVREAMNSTYQEPYWGGDNAIYVTPEELEDAYAVQKRVVPANATKWTLLTLKQQAQSAALRFHLLYIKENNFIDALQERLIEVEKEEAAVRKARDKALGLD